MPGFLIRDIAPEDLDDLQRAAVHLDSVNLPDDRDALARIIERSRRSFAAVASRAQRAARQDRCFVFVAAERDSGAVVGTSMIFAQHGSRRAPHVYFDVIEEERYSETLDRHFVPPRAAHRLQLQGAHGDRRPGRAARVPAPPGAARAAADVGALPLHRAAPGGLSRRGAVRADAAARARRHQPAVGVAGAAVHGPHLPGGGPAVAGEQGVHPRAVSAGSALRDAAAGARAGADRPGRARDQGRREDAARDRVQLRAPHRSVRRRAALPRAHRRHHAGARDARRAWPPPRRARRAGAFRPIVARERAEAPYFVAARTAVPVAEPPAAVGTRAAVTLALAADVRDACRSRPATRSRTFVSP